MINKTRAVALIASLLVVGSSCIVYAAKPKPKAAPKKAPVKPAASAHKETMGTTQLKGEYADMGSTYTLGKEYPWNFRLVSAEYSVAPITIGERTYVPSAEEKFLVLRMLFHNPRSDEAFLRWDTMGYTAVDPQDQNHDGLLDLGKVENNAAVSMNLKPAQKIEAIGVMRVPAAGEMPKLIVKSSDELVLRYNLKGKVKAIPAPYADPADKTGATALSEIKAEIGKPYYMGMFEITITGKGEYSSATEIAENSLDEEQRFFILPLTIKTLSYDKQYMRWDGFDTRFFDADGVELGYANDMLQASKDRTFSMDIPSGKEFSVRYLVKVPSDTDVKTMTMRREEGRTYTFDLGE